MKNVEVSVVRQDSVTVGSGSNCFIGGLTRGMRKEMGGNR